MDDCCRSSHILSLTAKKLTALENVGNPLLCRFLARWFLAGSLFKSYFEVVCREQKYDFTHMLKLLLTSIFEIWSMFVPCRYVGRSFVKGGGRPTDILEKLNEMAGFEPTEEIQLYEVSFLPCLWTLWTLSTVVAFTSNTGVFDVKLMMQVVSVVCKYFCQFLRTLPKNAFLLLLLLRKSNLSQMWCVSTLIRNPPSRIAR